MWILGLKGLNNQGACSLNADYNIEPLQSGHLGHRRK